MQASLRALLMLFSAALFLACFTQTHSATTRQKRELLDPSLTAAILEELLDTVRRDNNLYVNKRARLDFGYNNRYGVASSVGSKLMALKQAADWNGPGRKRRQASAEHQDES